MALFVLDRLLVLQDGHCFAKFSDGVSIWVGSAGLDCIVIDRDGQRLSFVPQYAPQSRSSIRERLQHLFAIRNRLHPNPIVFAHFVGSDPGLYPNLVRWPRHPISSLCSRVSESESVVFSCCRNYSLRLVPGSIHLTFPVPITGRKASAFIEQIWPADDCPPQWQHALQLAIQTGAVSIANSDDDVVDMTIPAARSRLPKDIDRHCSSLTVLDDALPDHYPVAVEWMSDAVWHVIGKGRSVSATFAADQSVLRSSDLKFFEHVSPWRPPALYSVEHVGEIDFASSSLPIVSAMHRACKLLLHYRTLTSSAAPQQAAPSSGYPPISSIKRHTCSVPSVGDFACFEDGRVSIRFYDRTIVNLDPFTERADIVTRDGTCVGVSLPCSNLSEELEFYVRTSIEYTNWANLSPEERLEKERKTQECREMVRKELECSEWLLKNR